MRNRERDISRGTEIDTVRERGGKSGKEAERSKIERGTKRIIARKGVE